MRRSPPWRNLFFALVTVAGFGCNPEPSMTPVQAAESAQPAEPASIHLNRPLPKLPTIRLWLGPEEMVAEIARTQQEQATGMMFRETMGENEGMIFVFPSAGPRAFYMKNTKVPLSIAYIDPAGKIVDIHDLHPLELDPVPSKGDNIQYALETPQGWFKRHNIGPGTLIKTEKGSLSETFFSRR